MIDLERQNPRDIVEEVNYDMEHRSKDSVESLLLFYYKIVTEPTIRTSSYRYIYAKHALNIICERLNDTETLFNFNKFHSAKVSYEVANPVKMNIHSDDDYTSSVKKNRVTKEQRFGTIKDTTRSQFKL
jgi:hypothetical protein